MRVATLLLAVLIPTFFITTLHHHHDASHRYDCKTCEVNHHNIHKNHVETAVSDTWANCYICHFVFSPVEKAQLFDISFENDFASKDFVEITPSLTQNALRYFSLRAPPFLA